MKKTQHPVAKPLSLAVTAALTGLGLAMALVAPAQADTVVSNSQGAITNTGTENITVTSTGTISALTYGVQNNGTIGTLNNSGLISVGSAAIVNNGTIGSLINSGSLSGGGNIEIKNNGTINILNNSGTISGNYGIDNNSGFIGTLNNSGLISGNSHGIYNNGGTIATLINSGSISGSNMGIMNYFGQIGLLINSGSIYGSATGVLSEDGTIGNFSNNGYISGGNEAITNVSAIGTLVNAGTLSGNGYVGIYNSGTIGTLSNSNLISGHSDGIYNTGTIGNLVNTGSIVASSGAYINNTGGTITTLTNGQLGLTYTGTLPTNYNTYFASGSYTPSSTFATTVFSSSSTGSITSYGIKLAPTGVTLATGVYLGVLISSSSFNVGNVGQTLTYSLNGYSVTYKLLANGTNYDLDIISFGNSVGGNNNGSNNISSGITPAVIAQHNNPAYYAARVIDANSTLSNLFSGVSGTAAQSAAASQSLPLVTGGATSVTQTALTSVNTIIDARQSANRGASSGDDFQTSHNMWLKAFGTEADQSDLDGVSGFKAHTGGVTFGADQKINDKLTLGAAFAYANSNVSSTVGGASNGINIKGYQLIGYGSLELNQRDSVDFQLDGGMSNNSGTRDINFADVVASSSYNSWTAHLGSSLNRRYDLSDRLTLTPSLRVDYTRINESGYQESGAGDFDLNVDSQRAEALVFGLDGKLDYKLSDTLALAANLGMGYDAMNKQDSIIAAYAGAPNASFITEGLNQGALISRAGAVLSYKLPKGIEISAHYDVEGRRNYLSQTASVKFNMPF